MSDTTTSTPEPEPFRLSEAEITGIADSVGIRADIVPGLKGGSYGEVRETAQRLYDIAPTSRTRLSAKDREDEEKRETEKANRAAILANKIKSHMGYDTGGKGES